LSVSYGLYQNGFGAAADVFASSFVLNLDVRPRF